MTTVDCVRYVLPVSWMTSQSGVTRIRASQQAQVHLQLELFNALPVIGAARTESWRGSQVQWIPFFSSSVRSPSPVIAPPMFHPFPSSLLFFPPPPSVQLRGLCGSIVSFPQCPAKMTASWKSWRGPNTLGSHGLMEGTRPVGPL